MKSPGSMLNFWGVDPGLFVLWLLCSHHEQSFASLRLGDHGALVSASCQNVCLCCLEPLAHQLSSFPMLADVMQRIPTSPGTELTLICEEISCPLILYYVVASQRQEPKSFGLNGSQMHRRSGLSWILNPQNQRFSSLSHRSCLLPYKIGLLLSGALSFPFISQSKNFAAGVLIK